MFRAQDNAEGSLRTKAPQKLSVAWTAYPCLAIGVALFAGVILYEGVGAVAQVLARAGWGIAAIALCHLPSLWADAMGWRRLLDAAERPPARILVWARWIGESINDLLPVMQVGGNVAKAWLLLKRGVPLASAGASVVVDVTLVLLTQIIFTLVGLVLLAPHLGHPGLAAVVLLGSAIMGLLLGAFYLAQRRGFLGAIARVSRRILGGWSPTSVTNGAEAIDSAMVKLYRNPRALVGAGVWHLLSWVLGIGEVWVGLRFLGHPVDIWTALLIESVGQAIRTGSFAVPGALGVQEGGYVLLGNELGIEPQVSLALSLARRAREILLGLPGLVAGQAEGLSGGRSRSGSAHRTVLARTFNAGGQILRPLGAFRGKIAERELLEQSRRRTGLEDFGDETFREPLCKLLESMEAEARLSPLGRVAARKDLIRLLSNRLRMERDRKHHPHIAAEEIRRPLIITGLPRTGTTLLHNLLALDPAHRVLLTWETLHPSPPPEAATYRTDERIRIAEQQVRWFHRLVKDFNRIHPLGARLPEECLVIFSHSFLSFQFETTHRLPSYLGWLEAQDLRLAYREHRRFLQHLQWRCPGERWVLKAPAHLFDLEALFSVYPDAGVIVTHRDPLQAAASNASLTAVLRSAFSDEVDRLEVGEECSRRWAEAINRSLRSRDRGCAPPERFLDLYYRDLTRDPLASVRRIYDHFGLPFGEGLEESIGRYLVENPKEKYGAHHYTLEEFGLDPEREKERFRAYRERFGL